jgi:CRISPR-associated protein Csm1
MGENNKKVLKELRNLIALGALLHDIGKVAQRAKAEELGKFPSKESDEFKYAHEEEGYEFIKPFLEKWKVLKDLKVEFEGIPAEDIIKASFYHHGPENLKDETLKLVAKIYQLADQISASERSEDDELLTKPLYKRLHPVFEKINLCGEENKKTNKGKLGFWVYPLKVLEINEETNRKELEKLIFPIKWILIEKKDLCLFKAFLQKLNCPTVQKKLLNLRLEERNCRTIKIPRRKIGFPSFNKSLLKLRLEVGNYRTISKGLKDSLAKETLTEEKDTYRFLSKVYHIFYKYLWSVPSSTYDPKKKAKHYPDISLFDHSRTVAAIATSLTTPYNLNVLKNPDQSTDLKEQLKLVLIEGDISGIQNFLFGIRNYKGVAKRLRGRSFFLAVLPDLIARYILDQLGYPAVVNILYSGGGKFQLLIGYEENIEKKLKDLQKNIEKVLIKEFGGKLGFVLEYEIFPLCGLENYSEVVKRIHRKLAKAKKRKFVENLAEFENLAQERFNRLLQENKSTKICPSCGWEVIEEEEEVCQWCEAFAKVGADLPKYEIVSISVDKGIINEVKEEIKRLSNKEKINRKFLVRPKKPSVLILEELGVIELIKNEKDFLLENEGYLRKLSDVVILNRTDFERNKALTGFKFLCLAVPIVKDEEAEEILKQKYGDTPDDPIEAEKILPFTVLEKLSAGDPKLGYLKADVDNLGLVFMIGLGKDYTFSRIANLSRSLDMFFSLYMDRLLRDKELKDLKEDYSDEKILDTVKSLVYTVYSGGDDLFLIAPWNVAINYSTEIRKQFSNYTCESKFLGISAGLGLFKGSYPVRLAANKTDSLESNAKSRVECEFRKDKIALLGSVLKWEQLKDTLEDLNSLKKALQEGKLSRGMIYRFYQMLKDIKDNTQNPAGRDEKLLRFIVYFYYQIARNVKDENLRKDLEKFFGLRKDNQIATQTEEENCPCPQEGKKEGTQKVDCDELFQQQEECKKENQKEDKETKNNVQKEDKKPLIDLERVLFGLTYLLMFTRKR